MSKKDPYILIIKFLTMTGATFAFTALIISALLIYFDPVVFSGMSTQSLVFGLGSIFCFGVSMIVFHIAYDKKEEEPHE